MNSDTWHNDPHSAPWSQDGTPSDVYSESRPESRGDAPFGHIAQQSTDQGLQAFDPDTYYAAPPNAPAQPAQGPQPYLPPSAPVAQPPAPNRSLIQDDTQQHQPRPGLTIGRKAGIVLFAFISLFGLMMMIRSISPLETGLTFALATIVGSLTLQGMDLRHMVTRALLSLGLGAVAAAAATSLLPHFGLWPADSTNLLVAMTFATVGTLAHSRLCLGLALIVLVNLLFQGDGLGLMPGRTQIAVLALFGIGLLGGVTAGSRFIASVSLLSLFVAHLHIMASAALPSGSALGVTLISALCAAALMRSTYLRGMRSAFEPMGVAICVFVITTLTFQLVLLGGNGGPDMLETAPMRGSVVTVLLSVQLIVLVSGLYDWFESRASLKSVLAIQAVLAVLTLMLIDPRRMILLPGIDASAEMAFLTGALLAGIMIRILVYAWQTDKPLLTAFCALTLMVEAILMLRFAMAGLDVAFAALVCAIFAIVAGAIMALVTRKSSEAISS